MYQAPILFRFVLPEFFWDIEMLSICVHPSELFRFLLNMLGTNRHGITKFGVYVPLMKKPLVGVYVVPLIEKPLVCGSP